MGNRRPSTYQLFENYLHLTWLDGHETLITFDSLRSACPCANCKGEPDLTGRRLMPSQQPVLTPASYELAGLQPVGQYGLQAHWADGHNTGIYTFEYLRSLCGCDRCLEKSAPAQSRKDKADE